VRDEQTIRIVVVDDHDVVRWGLTFFLQSQQDMKLVGEARNGAEAIRLCEELLPDVVLMDILMPEMDGVQAIRHLHQSYPDIKIIALTSSREEAIIKSALQAGAISYLVKTVAPEELSETIHAAFAGKRMLSREVTDTLIYASNRANSPHYSLTEREIDVLKLITRGYSNAEIAAELSISLSTVKFHTSSILSKLGVSSRTEAVAIAIEHHLVG
jgi:NarL family two-component system response regulator LiaR